MQFGGPGTVGVGRRAAVAGRAGLAAWPERLSGIRAARHARVVNVKPGVAAPPVPVVTGIRMGTHPDCGYDRLVLHIRGPVPGYEITYVTKSAAGQAARTVATSGDRYLLLTLHPAQGHRQSGAATSSPVGAVAFPVLRGYSVASDFEGALCIVVVVARPAAFRVGELSGRLFIDVAG